jgi:hypothetical protein
LDPTPEAPCFFFAPETASLVLATARREIDQTGRFAFLCSYTVHRFKVFIMEIYLFIVFVKESTLIQFVECSTHGATPNSASLYVALPKCTKEKGGNCALHMYL